MTRCKKNAFALSCSVFLLFISFAAQAQKQKREFYELRIYHFKDAEQEKTIDGYLQNALLPALHRKKIQHIGVFKPITPDTADQKRYVLIPYSSLNQFATIPVEISSDKSYLEAGKAYLDAPFHAPPYSRMETILLQAFSHQPTLQTPNLQSARGQRVYELRSYEGHTEKIFRNKVHMFNEGGEVTLFKRLQFNAVFYGEVLSGCRMPNLMYMTTFENKASHDEHWATFRDDPEWKTLSGRKEYQNNVSRIEIFLLHPTEYSDY
jgi:hypothetical protein